MFHRSAFVGVLSLAGSSLLAACGGGGGDGRDPKPVRESETLAIQSLAAVDGFVKADGTVVTSDRAAIHVGDDTNDHESRGFLRFVLSEIPEGSEILSATFQVDQSFVAGTPFATLVEVRVDLVDVGSALDATDFDGGPLAANVGTLSVDESVGPRTLEVTEEVAAALRELRKAVDFRLRFAVATDGDGFGDLAGFNDPVRPRVAGKPILVVVFRRR
jgi:hypothetical protein